MNKTLVPVSQVLSQAFELAKKVISNPSGRTTVTGVNFQNGLKVMQAVQVPQFAHKYEYREILITLIKSCGYTLKQAADACGLSYSYAAKLVRQK